VDFKKKENLMKKKSFVCLLVIALLCALCACGGPAPQTEEAGEPENSAQTETGQMPKSLVSPEDGGEDSENSGGEAPGAGEEPSNTPEEEISDTPPVQAETSPAESQTAPAAKPEQTQPALQEPPPAPAEKPAAPQTAPAEKPPAPAEKPAAPEPESTPEPDPEPAPAPADPKTVAQGLVGHPVSELYAAIGRPISSDYAPSCLVENGEDGELVYEGFVVYTEKGPDFETVYAVM
jgi:predicted small lipoprotein YifL